MRVDVFLSEPNVSDLATPLVVGEHLSVPLLANVAEVTYHTPPGPVWLRRYGLLEYAFCGRIVDVGPPGHMYEVLLDCGVPVTLLSQSATWPSPRARPLYVTDLVGDMGATVTPD